MSKNELREKIEAQVQKAIFSYAVFRPESAIVLAMTIILSSLGAMNLSWFPGEWWLWLAFGLVGEALIIRTTLKDDKFYRSVMDKMFHTEFDISKLHSDKLKQKLAKALEYREMIVKEIERENDTVLDDHLLNVVNSVEDWLAGLYHLAQSLDTYWRDPIIARDMEAVPQELARFKETLARQVEGATREELEKTIAAKEAQWQMLQNLKETMATAQLKLENTTAAMGTIYTQVVLLGAKDADSNRAKRLQEDVTEQVQALEDIRAAMDDVYRQNQSA